MTDSSQAQATESADAEARKYVEQLREAPADQVLSEIVVSVVNAAQVKLGRSDARIFIDLAAAVLDSAREHLPPEMATEVDQAIAQLRISQVEAEAKPETNTP